MDRHLVISSFLAIWVLVASASVSRLDWTAEEQKFLPGEVQVSEWGRGLRTRVKREDTVSPSAAAVSSTIPAAPPTSPAVSPAATPVAATPVAATPVAAPAASPSHPPSGTASPNIPVTARPPTFLPAIGVLPPPSKPSRTVTCTYTSPFGTVTVSSIGSRCPKRASFITPVQSVPQTPGNVPSPMPVRPFLPIQPIRPFRPIRPMYPVRPPVYYRK